MKKNFVEENVSTVNAYYQSLGEQTETYTVPYEIIPYRGYLGNDPTNALKVVDIINETDETGAKKYKRILIIAPTGSGKTTMMADINRQYPGYSALMEPNKILNLQNQSSFNLEAIVGGTKASQRKISIEDGYSIVYDLAGYFTKALKENPDESSIIIIDEPQELYYAKTYRENALNQINQLEQLSKDLPTSSIIHITATPGVLESEKYDYILQFEDTDRIPVGNNLDIIENNSKLSFEEGLLHLLVGMVRTKKEKALVEIQSIEIIDKIRDNLNSLGITAVSLTSDDKDTSSTYIDHKSGKLKVKSCNEMYKAIIEDSCLPKFTSNGKEIAVFLATSILGQGSSIKGIIDKDKNIEKDINLVPVYTVKDKPTCSIDYVLQFLARPRFHVNRAIVFMNKESYDAKIQKLINTAQALPSVTTKKTQTGNYHLSTKDVQEFKTLRNACKDLGLDYEKFEEASVYKVAVFGAKFKSLSQVMEYHLSIAHANLKHFSNSYHEFDSTNDNIDKVNQALDNILGLYCIDGIKNSLNIIKRNEDGLYIDKEVLWLNIYMNYIGQYYRCSDLYYQELSMQLEMPINILPLELTDIDLVNLKLQHQESIHETLSHAKSNDPGFKDKILKNQLDNDMKWVSSTEEFKLLSAITKLTDDLDYAYDIISSNDIKVVIDIYDKELRKKLSNLTAPERRILESYAHTKENNLFLDNVAKLIIDSKYWLHISRGLNLGVSMETLCYQMGTAKSFDMAKNYVDKTQTVNLLKKYAIKELQSCGRAGMEIVVALDMFYDSHNGKFFDGKNKVTINDIDKLRIALDENKIIKSLRYDTSGIGKSGAKYTKKDAKNLLSCIFVLDYKLTENEKASGVIYKLSRIAKSAR